MSAIYSDEARFVGANIPCCAILHARWFTRTRVFERWNDDAWIENPTHRCEAGFWLLLTVYVDAELGAIVDLCEDVYFVEEMCVKPQVLVCGLAQPTFL
ncbi:hypothetical protein ACFV06_39495 [Streptomyces sp. NPDC059618]|uniref:hypothetical protein n=1 Tax=Streptomyces sp. NPDC059618 TaxID=3346887 RepID=UPI0036936D45